MKRVIFAAAVMLLSVSAHAAQDKQEKEPFDRGIGISTSTFIPKGTVGAGVSFSYNNYNLGNATSDVGYSMLFSLIDGVKGNIQTWGVAPFVSYFLADNFSVGVRFDYDRSSLGIGNAALSLSSDLGFEIKDFHYLNQSYTGALTARYYMPIAGSKRFAMFTELRALGGYGQAKNWKVQDGLPFGTYQDIYKFELGLVPGISVFVTNEVAIEISVGLLGFNYQKVQQTTNQVEYSEMESSGANFKINLFSLGLGMSFYIPTGQNRTKKHQ